MWKKYNFKNFILLIVSMLNKKIKKSSSEWLNRIRKSVFLRSQLRGKRDESRGRKREEGSGWGCSLKEWKDVANTQGFF
jgi:hypothetical protein